MWHRPPGEALPSASASVSVGGGSRCRDTDPRIFSFSCFPLGCELFTGNYLFYFLPPDFAVWRKFSLDYALKYLFLWKYVFKVTIKEMRRAVFKNVNF